MTNQRTAQWDWRPEEIIVLGEGEGAFGDNKRKSPLDAAGKET